MRTVIAEVGDKTTVTLWVLADNERARHFYRRHGFQADGVDRYDDIGGESLARGPVPPRLSLTRRSGPTPTARAPAPVDGHPGALRPRDRRPGTAPGARHPAGNVASRP